MAKNIVPQNKIAIYQTQKGALELQSDIKNETIWATQADISNLFGKSQSVVSRHIASILRSGEIDKKSNMHKMHITNIDKPVIYYSLDMVLAVGYRTNSAKAIAFRQWATKTLRSYIVDGYAINRSRVQNNYDSFLQAIADVKALLPSGTIIDNESVLELITLFSDTWLSLEAYDTDRLATNGSTKKEVTLTAVALAKALGNLKSELVSKGEATDIFGADRYKDSIAGIVGDVMQSFGGKPVYVTVEERAAHLLYFIVKNHPFTDGNKRSGAYAFIWYLQKAGILNKTRITPPALTALTLLVAESESKSKDRTISLILQLLKTK
ncbi:MAG: RhuM [Candidatus Wolfebacteria bacterium GW2011_GWC2_39_22]|uniref:RhuM n=1 Tax=Candidatus Wolfebacteria bacterium GW2011_GWC2_39_22 TaxID=1619013 RepID=A0A0G0N8R6_9BACT|nr:MAG: RhuM [Candidatus Wolfebacteria bacterium GW2011_GWC2_39_22]HBI25775.1 death-on-curing protein [Candidatus Wolfebacteria bacterium]